MISYLLVEILIGERFGIGMFRERSINIDLTFRCTLECPKCMRQSIREKGFKEPAVDISFDNLKSNTSSLSLYSPLILFKFS